MISGSRLLANGGADGCNPRFEVRKRLSVKGVEAARFDVVERSSELPSLRPLRSGTSQPATSDRVGDCRTMNNDGVFDVKNGTSCSGINATATGGENGLFVL